VRIFPALLRGHGTCSEIASNGLDPKRDMGEKILESSDRFQNLPMIYKLVEIRPWLALNSSEWNCLKWNCVPLGSYVESFNPQYCRI
jgi:hypothetical protein